jgi:type 1 glutamine amidotransferase
VNRILLVFLLGACLASAKERIHVHIISGSNEYKSRTSLQPFQAWLSEAHGMQVSASWVRDGATDLPDVDKIASVDVLLVFARRLKLPESQMKLVRAHWQAGKAVVGIRTASHAFSRDENETFDRKVMGGNYTGHYGNTPVKVTNVADHPVLQGVSAFTSAKLYKAGPLADSATLLQTGTTGDKTESLTWVNSYKGGRSFYSSAGVPSDFQDDNFRRLLLNAIHWTAKSETKAK